MEDKQFTTMWQQQVLPSLEELQRSQKKARARAVWGVVFLLSVIGLIAPIDDIIPFTWWLPVVSLTIITVAGWRWSKNSNNFQQKFKQLVLAGISSALDFSWQINPDNQNYKDQGNKIYQKSELYHGHDSVYGDDVLVANTKQSEVGVYEVTSERNNGRNSIIIFDGFIVEIPLDNSFMGKTFVQTESDAGFFDSGSGGLFNLGTETREVILKGF